MGKWSVRKRKGFDTPSLEEFLWYHFTPGGIYKTSKAEGGLESEEFDYYVLSGLGWFATMAYAADAAAAAKALGMVNVGAELTLARPVSVIRFAFSPLGLMSALAVVGTITQFDVAAHHGAGTRGSPGSIAPSYHLVDSKPWWEQYW